MPGSGRRAGAPGATLLVIEADDAAALGALLRPLPHYGRSSWLVFDGGESWIAASGLPRELSCAAGLAE